MNSIREPSKSRPNRPEKSADPTFLDGFMLAVVMCEHLLPGDDRLVHRLLNCARRAQMGRSPPPQIMLNNNVVVEWRTLFEKIVRRYNAGRPLDERIVDQLPKHGHHPGMRLEWR